jgi:hypothetical protein
VPRVCPGCGSPLSDHERNVRFRLPDPVLSLPDEERANRVWGNDVLMNVQDLGGFVRALLPVHLVDGTSLTFGLWLGVHPDDLQHLWSIWWEPEYAEVSFTGHVANDLAPWSGQVLARPVRAEVRDPDSVPIVVASDDDLVARIIGSSWPPDLVLPPFADLL